MPTKITTITDTADPFLTNNTRLILLLENPVSSLDETGFEPSEEAKKLHDIQMM